MDKFPDLGKQMSIVMQSIPENRVHTAVETILKEPISSITIDTQIRDAVLPLHDLQPLEPMIMPSWANLDQILVAAQGISQPSFWEEMLQSSNPKEAQRLMRMMDIGAQNDLAKKISYNNGRFFSISFAYMFLAAATGADAEFLLSPIGLAATPKKALDAAGRMFQTNATSPEDFIDRLLVLFPDSGSDTNPKSAYKILLDNEAFEKVSFLRGRNVCPIIKPTQFIFEGFGKMLRKPQGQYQLDLKQAITK